MRSLRVKPLGKILVRIVLGLAMVLAILLTFAGSESALRWGAQHAERMSGGKLMLRGVHGSLYGPLSIEALRFQTTEKRFEVHKATLDWAPFSLLQRHLKIKRLALQELRIIAIKPSTEPLQLPETLHLPVTISAPSIRVTRVVFQSGDQQQALSAIDLGVEKTAHRYQLQLRNISSVWGSGQGDMLLADMRPFALTAHAQLQQQEGGAYRADADVSGNLSQLLLQAKASAIGGQAELSAKLAPFVYFPLIEGHLKAAGINPALLRKDLPTAEISADISLLRQGVDGLTGDIALRNKLPGTWDQARLPLRSMETAFSGVLRQLDLHGMHLDLADGGTFKGDGQIKDQRLQLKLSTANFNPQGVLRKMRPMRLAGDLQLEAQTHRQQLMADLQYQRFKLHLDASLQDAQVELHEAIIQSEAGSLALHGSLALQGEQGFQLAGALQGFNPADFGDYPVARVNAALTAMGQLATNPQVTVSFAIADSQFRQQPLSGQGRLSLSATRIWNSALQLRLARNQFEVKGALGHSGDRLSLQIAAENLAAFDPRLNGQARATGSLAGRFSAPSGQFDIQVSNFAWQKKYRVASLLAKGRLDQGVDGPLILDARVRELATPQFKLDQASFNAQGTRSQHTLQLLAKNADIDAVSQLQGGWRGDAGWFGQVMSLSNRGRHALVLKFPAKLELAQRHFLLSEARLEVIGANLIVHELTYDSGQFASRGEFNGLPLAYLKDSAQQAEEFKTNLTLSGDWLFAARDKVNGHIALQRESGDITLPTDPQTTLGLTRLALKIDAVNNQLRGSVEATGTHLGHLKADGESVLSRRDGVWGIAGDAPLHASADLAIQSLAWLAPLLNKTGALVFDGAVQAMMRVDGHFAQPQLSGSLSGDRFSIALPEQGLRFSDGRFQAQLQDQAVLLKALTIRAGEGKLTSEGRLDFESGVPNMQLSLKADKLAVFSRPDRLLILSGSGDVVVAAKKVQVNAQLKADRGVIELPKGDTPTSSDDVVVLGRTATEKKGLPYAMNFALDVDLGERFFIKGKGLDAQLGGALKLTSVDGALPNTRGSIRVVKGAYSAYGQRLEIDRGILNFQGPIDNPGLNIIALRKNQPVEAGVAVTGTVQSPTVKLVSDPSVPDSEKLSWLVLGHGVESSSKQEFDALQAAAGVLLSAGESVTLQQRIAHAAGLEEVSLKGAGGLEGTVLTLGKRLSSRAYLSYEQGLTGATSLAKINYTLTKRLSVRAQAGTRPAVDLFYTFSFD